MPTYLHPPYLPPMWGHCTPTLEHVRNPAHACRGTPTTAWQRRTDGDALPPTHGSAAAVIHTAAAMVKHASLLSLLSITILPHLSVHIMMSA